MKIYCMKCEAENEEGAARCVKCGHRLKGEEATGRRSDEATKGDQLTDLTSQQHEFLAEKRERKNREREMGQMRGLGIVLTVCSVFATLGGCYVGSLVDEGTAFVGGLVCGIFVLSLAYILRALAGIWRAVETTARK